MKDPRITELVDRALDYRGHVTVERHDGSTLVGFVYNRSDAHVELFDERAIERVSVSTGDIANITLTGDDTAARAQRHWERRRDSLEPRETSAWGEWEDRPALILVALPLELHGVAPALGAKVRGASATGRLGETRVIARAVGVGGGAARIVTDERPRLVISCGLAGALDSSLESGDLVLGASIRDESGEAVIARESVLQVARRSLAGMRVAEGEVLCSTRVAATRQQKRALARPGRFAVDLESWAAARAAQRAGVPWLALRVVLDPLEVDLPPFATDARGAYLAPALRHALGGPRAAFELGGLAVRTAIALRSLRRAMHELVPVVGQLETVEVRR